MTPRLQAEHDLPPAELNAIEERLNGDNRLHTGRDDDRGLVFALRDEAGQAIGVAAGYSWAGIAELKLMWVEESYRGRGHAKALLNAFVAGAAARGARRVWVSTHDFQAPGLYEKAGFERMAEFTGWPEGHSNIILCKTMAPR
ncbi:GNAT family N-acetyltransferase [Mesorhizobium sp. VK22B]|uniref:GNAT family N-acetyltransferase n=1 Tax=Mesorhizobium captivum TaxID=3072319 RepID=A0ABU4Z0E0_9HYPH|nr:MULTISPECIES: GNAT family N-acetyltransferase [unclassified Mesorhizobium]MDX8492685.1 GNAT family N-acetyltransferase [Mesorhizobium sp. VK22B]MDX8505999.1 GNAT family N-acetyltransferase [Mesorhizobium sp. VK22E]